jgi:hypothetical protein
LTETTRQEIKKYLKQACFLLSSEMGDFIRPDDYEMLLRKYDKLFMEKMGIKNDFCIRHVIHWILKDAGMYSKFYIESGNERGKSVFYGNTIDTEKINSGVERYEVVSCEKVRKNMCSDNHL